MIIKVFNAHQQLDPPPQIIKTTKEPSNTVSRRDATGTYGTLQPTTAGCVLFSRAQKVFSRMDHMLAHNICLNKV